MWRRRREKNFMEEKVRRRQKEKGGKPWRGGKKEKEFMPLKFKMFPESEVLPHGYEFSGAPQMWLIVLGTKEKQGKLTLKAKAE